MQKLNNTTDCVKFLKEGSLTKSFLSDELVKEKVMFDFNSKQAQGNKVTKLESLCKWIHRCVRSTNDQTSKENLRFKRTAKEIWESGFCTGCTDWAMLFATLARQIGIPTTLLQTAEYNWLRKLQNNEKQLTRIGHSFCECFYDGKWVLVDPTLKKFEPKYNCDKLILPYEIYNGNIYIPYFRGLDLGKKQTIKEYVCEMEKECINLKL